MPSPTLILVLLFAASFTLATQLCAWREQSAHHKTKSGSVLETLMGDSRRLFANHFFTKADVYFHSGVYPSIFDEAQRARKTALQQGAYATEAKEPPEHASENHKDHHEHDDSDAVTGLFGKPRDWLEAFGRHFLPTAHTHLSQGNEREMLPWLKWAAELDPNQVETYTVTAYWLRSRMGKVKEAEAFLQEGLRANPDSFEILFELGRLREEDHKDTFRARNLYELALKKWEASEAGKKEPDNFTLMQITMHLARLEERAGRLPEAIRYLGMLEPVSPHPESIRAQIAELKARVASGTAP